MTRLKLQDTEPPVIFTASESASYRYELSIRTGVWPGSGTTANTSFIIYGDEGNSGRLTIQQDLSTGFKPIFARGTEQTFAFVLDQALGDIYALQVWHDSSGNDPSWFLEDITIKIPSSEGSWLFIFEMWLSLENESCSNEVLQNLARSAPNITTKALKEMFSDGHLWLSVLSKTQGNCFTRVQRITSCLCLLFCTMAANAAFYYWGTQSYQTISLGPLKFSARQAIASIQSNLLVLPVHVIILLFKKTSARLQERLWRWLLYITWGLCSVLTVTSAVVTVLYSLMWESEKSQEWVSSVAVSIFQDILIVQPCKCLLLVSLTVMFSKCKAKKVLPFGQHGGVVPDKKVRSPSSFWKWINESLIPYLYASHYQSIYQQTPGLSGELTSTIIGMLRLRQLRARKVQCPVHQLANSWQQSCYDSYSQEKEFREPFQPNQATSLIQFRGCPLPWVYQTAKELNSSSQWGQHASYGGGGYSADLGYEEETARTITNLLQSENWVDRQTRAVIVEFSVFNPTSNILAVCSLFFELLQTGQATVFKRIDTISLYNTDSILQVFQGLCLVIFFAMVFFKFGETIVAVLYEVLSHFRECTKHAAEHLCYNNFQTSVLWADVENSFLAVLVFLTTVKLLQLTYFNMYTRVFARALRIWMCDLPSFMIVLSIIFLAFLQAGILVFGSSNGRYSSFWPAFSFQLEMVLGKVKARPIIDVVQVNSIAGHVFVIALLVSVTILLMNFFLSTLNDAVNEAKTMEELKENEQETSNSKYTPDANVSNIEMPDDDNQRKKHSTGKQHGKTPKVRRCLVKGCFRKSKRYFDQISNHVKTIDTIQNLPQMYILDEKLTEVLERLDAAHADDIDTSEKRVRFGDEIIVQVMVHRDPMP
ncbi:hypothetical protein OS493_034884 [Desmophyllum pertusum]|uniref:PLAT domain-containing protein n=1 Tax=Desmophyllum pertusum TaxID=174260 RepID=A0A9W9ZIR5_9CNID|nr:hypothetical protein OS493_034884 [Desmophyllum pertusum]